MRCGWGNFALVEAEIELTDVVFRGRRSMLCRINDGSGGLLLRFFHFSHVQQQSLHRGARLRCYGEVRRGPGTLEMVHPEYTLISNTPLPLDTCLTPVYPSVTGIHQATWRKLTDQAIKQLGRLPSLIDLLPATLMASAGLGDLHTAIRFVHRPPAGTALAALQEGRHPAVARLAFEELLAYRLALLGIRSNAQQVAAPVLKPNKRQLKNLCSQFVIYVNRRTAARYRRNQHRSQPCCAYAALGAR